MRDGFVVTPSVLAFRKADIVLDGNLYYARGWLPSITGACWTLNAYAKIWIRRFGTYWLARNGLDLKLVLIVPPVLDLELGLGWVLHSVRTPTGRVRGNVKLCETHAWNGKLKVGIAVNARIIIQLGLGSLTDVPYNELAWNVSFVDYKAADALGVCSIGIPRD
jgi:hypothetical protein